MRNQPCQVLKFNIKSQNKTAILWHELTDRSMQQNRNTKNEPMHSDMERQRIKMLIVVKCEM